MADLKRLHQLEAVVASLKRKIDEREVRSMAGGRLQRGAARRGFCANKEVGFAVDQGGQSTPHERMVINDQHRLLFRRSLTQVCGHGCALSLGQAALRT